MIIISDHAKKRLRERAKICSSKDQINFVYKALKIGKMKRQRERDSFNLYDIFRKNLYGFDILFRYSGSDVVIVTIYKAK